jgi:DNA helicase HerA-like ATPase
MLDPEERRRHLYFVGQTGTGKSTLPVNLIEQDLAAGEGLGLLDPHGDLAAAVLAQYRARTLAISSM